MMYADRKSLKSDKELAAAVKLIIRNCGKSAYAVLFDPHQRQTRKAIMMISRTADTRQRYRIDGVKDGRFRSVGPQNDDPVYDTVAFKEVPSRLWRARGTLLKLETPLNGETNTDVVRECHQLVKMTLKAARQLRKFVNRATSDTVIVPPRLSREAVTPILYSRKVRGKTVGKARGALHLIIKNVWDYPEMQRRGIGPDSEELRRTHAELDTIIAVAERLLSPAD